MNGVGLVVVIYLLALLVQTVKRNNDLREQVSTLESSIARLDSDRETLAYKLRYYSTDDFREKEARAKLGLQMPGESLIILPPAAPVVATETAPARAVHRSNLAAWWAFLRGKP
jgi:cell division protein FtsB